MINRSRFTPLTLLVLSCAALQTTVLAEIQYNADGGTFSPNGSANHPWNLLFEGAAKAAGGQTVRIDDDVYETGTISSPCTLASSGGTRVIGRQPSAETTFDCVFYNLRLNTWAPPWHEPSGWADGDRLWNIVWKHNEWGRPDFVGFCEVWGDYQLQDYLLENYATSELPFRYKGPGGSAFAQTSGLLAMSSVVLGGGGNGIPENNIYTDYAGEDGFANKGFIVGRGVKDGFGIIVVVAHTQADSLLATWAEVHRARYNQLIQIRDRILAFRSSYPSDVVIIMGDLNVWGDDRGPIGSPLPQEYAQHLSIILGLELGGGMDVAKHFHPHVTEYTYSGENSLANYFQGGVVSEDESARLDYFIAINSKDGTRRIQPSNYRLLKSMTSEPITASGHTDSNLSDHYGIAADFRIIEVGE